MASFLVPAAFLVSFHRTTASFLADAVSCMTGRPLHPMADNRELLDNISVKNMDPKILFKMVDMPTLWSQRLIAWA